MTDDLRSSLRTTSIREEREERQERQDPPDSPANATGDDQSCVPMVMHIDLPPPLHPRTLILGEPVLQRYYTVFDATANPNPRVGFAPALHGKA
ncbi:unnamed protein product [Effrenium voratum]|uniref:Peptidase A1 domain-containing protein n=1 Tax=Effrenium voratum TaxID=2562239 RepID=A0AA36NHF8_9DINO|nr:unnamed protein product [Effrenium voratum]